MKTPSRSLPLLCVLMFGGTSVPIHAQPLPVGNVLSIDFNERVQDEAALTMPAFRSFVIESNLSATAIQTNPTFRSFVEAGRTFRVTLSGNGTNAGYDDRLRTTPTNSGGFTESLLLRDFVFSRTDTNQGGLDLRIDGLTPGQTYLMTVWSFDSGSLGHRVSDWFVNGTLVKEDYIFDGAVPPVSDADYRFDFPATASPEGRVLIEGRRKPGSVDASGRASFGVFLNAVRVAVPPPPTLNCPGNLTVNTCADNGDQVFFSPSATSACGTVTVTCTPPSDSVFPLGSTPVTCRTLDACGQVVSCTFTVTVVRARNCVEVASETGGEAFTPRGGMDLTAAMLAELIRRDPPLPPGGNDEGENEIEDPGPAPAPAPVAATFDPLASAGPAAPAAAQTPAPVTSWNALGPGGGFPSDAQVAVSHTHVIVSGRAWMGIYNKAGTQLQTISARSLFMPLGLDDGSTDAINSYNDIRMIFDSYRLRFWIVATGKNKNQTDANKARKTVALAVSKTENPLDGWYLYWWDAVAHWGVANDVIYKAGDVADYPTIGIDPNLFQQTIGVQGKDGSTRYTHVVFFNANQMAAGLAGGSVSGWQFWDLKNPDGTTLVQLMQAVVHHGNTGRSYYVSRRDNNKLIVWALTDPFTPQQSMSRVALTFSPAWQNPVDAPQSGSSKKIKMTNLGTHPMKATYRGGQLVLVTHDARDWFGDGQMLTSLRLIRLFVLGFPNIPTVGDPSFINRRFGQNGPGDSSSAHVYYAWPAVEVNKNHDMAVVYARSSSQLFPEVRVSAYFDGESDIRPSRLIKAGEASADIPKCDSMGNVTGPGTTDPIPWGDNGGASVDPKDDVSIWIAQQYARTTAACNGNYQVWVAKMFGTTFSDWHFKDFNITVGNFQPGTEMEVAGVAENQGDGTAPTNRLAICLSRPSFSDLVLTEVALPALRPGEDFPFRLRVTIPADIEPCDARLKAVISSSRIEDEYSVDNNIAMADVPSELAIRLVQTSGPYRVRVSGKEGCRFTLQASPDFVRWQDLTTQTIVSGSYEFVDTDTSFTHRFYRAQKAP